MTTVMGPTTVRVRIDESGSLAVTFTNESPLRRSFVDLHRVETGREARLELGPEETCVADLASGDVDVKLGLYIRMECAE